MGENERYITPRERQELEVVTTQEIETIDPAILNRVLGYSALEYYVPVDPMDDLQCDSCQ